MSDNTINISVQSGADGAEVCRIAVRGDATIYTAAELKDQLLPQLCVSRRLEIDLSGVAEVDTAGLQVLLLCRREAELAGRELVLRSPSRGVRDLIGLYRLEAALPVLAPAPEGT
jgi:anti-anti-sigma factor